MGEYYWLCVKFKAKVKKNFRFSQGLGVSDMKKEYTLKIIYDPTNDEIDHLSEHIDENINYMIEINGRDIPISNEMGDFMLEHCSGEEIGIS